VYDSSNNINIEKGEIVKDMTYSLNYMYQFGFLFEFEGDFLFRLTSYPSINLQLYNDDDFLTGLGLDMPFMGELYYEFDYEEEETKAIFLGLGYHVGLYNTRNLLYGIQFNIGIHLNEGALTDRHDRRSTIMFSYMKPLMKMRTIDDRTYIKNTANYFMLSLFRDF
jgi:hypothetical protein